ncbi:MAG: YidH family protein [Chitinophagaceae bacterium]
MKEEIKNNAENKASDHLANERTYLAWIRTCIGIMAFGFVVVKFSLFIKELSMVLGKQLIIQQHGYSAIIGVFLVAFGALLTLFSFLRYKLTEKQLNVGTYKPSSLLLTILTIFVVIIAILLVIYLIHSI